MKNIILTKGYEVIVDDIWFEVLNQWQWHISNGYAIRCIGSRENKKHILMHRYIMMAPEYYQVDHINRNRLDNRLCNLRLITPEKNYFNRAMLSNNKSGFKGVCFDKTRNKYIASIQKNKKQFNLGRYDTAEEAAKVYNEAAKELFGEYAFLNIV